MCFIASICCRVTVCSLTVHAWKTVLGNSIRYGPFFRAVGIHSSLILYFYFWYNYILASHRNWLLAKNITDEIKLYI